MNKIEHYKKAEELIDRYYQDIPVSRQVNFLIEGLIHATLAASTIGMLDANYVHARVDSEDKLNL